MNEFIYELVTDERTGEQIIKRTDADGLESWIPMVEGNKDYQAYLASQEEGN